MNKSEKTPEFYFKIQSQVYYTISYLLYLMSYSFRFAFSRHSVYIFESKTYVKEDVKNCSFASIKLLQKKLNPKLVF